MWEVRQRGAAALYRNVGWERRNRSREVANPVPTVDPEVETSTVMWVGLALAAGFVFILVKVAGEFALAARGD